MNTNTTWNIFCKTNLQNKFIESNDNIVASISGGMDSVCMLHMLYRLKKKININILIVNFNHNLRQDSYLELNLIKQLSHKFKIDYIYKNLKVKEYSQKYSLSIETAGRELRYLNLEKIAKEYKFNKIALAHNANDNAETMLMWLLRGSGSFIGIPHNRLLKSNILIIRPLLSIKRKLIENYINYHNLPFCIDKSNYLNIYTRNKIRFSIIPALEKINPRFIEHTFNITCIQLRDNIYLQQIVDCLQKQCVNVTNDVISLDLTIFLRYNKAIQFRMMKNIIPIKKCNHHITFIINKLLKLSSFYTYRISKEWICKISGNKLFFIKNT
ncbi:MAG: tRNA lysidine(34) synthetase TilS [Endomicrobium sp.]|jgi:tRNA(Ile)-lysidine synthase|nr:tRNA lysidine(34) synthetase TilS [Endomicrobium sp.]